MVSEFNRLMNLKPKINLCMRSDKELLDFLEKLNTEKAFTGKCVLRQSTNGRGWRLHETLACEFIPRVFDTVREAINTYIDLKGGE